MCQQQVEACYHETVLNIASTHIRPVSGTWCRLQLTSTFYVRFSVKSLSESPAAVLADALEGQFRQTREVKNALPHTCCHNFDRLHNVIMVIRGKGHTVNLITPRSHCLDRFKLLACCGQANCLKGFPIFPTVNYRLTLIDEAQNLLPPIRQLVRPFSRLPKSLNQMFHVVRRSVICHFD